MSKGFNNFSNGSNPNQDSDPNTHSFRSSSDVRFDIRDVNNELHELFQSIKEAKEQIKSFEKRKGELTDREYQEYFDYCDKLKDLNKAQKDSINLKLQLNRELAESLKNEAVIAQESKRQAEESKKQAQLQKEKHKRTTTDKNT